jgi:hypothetical protein
LAGNPASPLPALNDYIKIVGSLEALNRGALVRMQEKDLSMYRKLSRQFENHALMTDNTFNGGVFIPSYVWYLHRFAFTAGNTQHIRVTNNGPNDAVCSLTNTSGFPIMDGTNVNVPDMLVTAGNSVDFPVVFGGNVATKQAILHVVPQINTAAIADIAAEAIL